MQETVSYKDNIAFIKNNIELTQENQSLLHSRLKAICMIMFVAGIIATFRSFFDKNIASWGIIAHFVVLLISMICLIALFY